MTRVTRRTMSGAVVMTLAALTPMLGACGGGGAPAGRDECLIGEWVPDLDQQIAGTTDTLTAAGAEVTDVSVSGEAVIEFTTTAMTTRYEDQVSDLTVSMGGQEYRTVTSTDGSMTASYWVRRGNLVLSAVDASGVKMTFANYLDGVRQPEDDARMSDAQAAQVQRGGSATVTYTCDEDTLTMTTPDLGVGLSAETVLHRR